MELNVTILVITLTSPRPPFREYCGRTIEGHSGCLIYLHAMILIKWSLEEPETCHQGTKFH